MANNSAVTVALWSLHQSLTQFTSDSSEVPAALDLSAFLLKVAASDACAAVRNTQRLYRLVGRARDTCRAVKDLITKVEDEGDFAAFESYTDMIGPLEE